MRVYDSMDVLVVAFAIMFVSLMSVATPSYLLQYQWTDNYYIASRYFPELIMSDVM